MNSTRNRLAIAALALLCLSTAPTRAQGPISERSGPLFNPISRSQMTRYTDGLTLDRDQTSAAMSLYDAYRHAMRQAMKQADKALDDQTDLDINDEASLRRYHEHQFDTIISFESRADDLARSLFKDMRTLLTPRQAELMPAVELMRGRDAHLRWASVAGDGVDLIRILDDLKIDRRSSPELRDVLEQYARDIGRAGIAKHASFLNIYEATKRMDPAFPDLEKSESCYADVLKAALAVRDINKAAARRVAVALPEPDAARFDAEFRNRCFPRIYRPSPVQKRLDEARKLAGITDEHRAALDTIAAAYERDAKPLNLRLESEVESKQSELPGKTMAIRAQWEHEAPADDPYTRALEARRALETRTLSRIDETIGAALAAHPKRPDRFLEGHEPAFFPDMDNDINKETEKEWNADDAG